MSIYDYLGIESLLVDMEIPTETILENINGDNLNYMVNAFFDDVDAVTLKASLNRNEHYLQIIEVQLNTADHISEISFILQKAIKYRILFIFVYDNRNLILHRNFNLTQSTENVYSQHINFCTDWIYDEYLCDDILCHCDVTTIENEYDDEYDEIEEEKEYSYDNNDFLYFEDIIGNAQKLTACISNCDLVSGRWLYDWYYRHSVNQYLSLNEIISSEFIADSIYILDENLFIEKSSVINTILDMLNLRYPPDMKHTGKYPANYFVKVDKTATYEDEQNMKYIIFNKSNNVNYDYNNYAQVYYDEIKEITENTPEYFNRLNYIYPSKYDTLKNAYMDTVLRIHLQRGYSNIEEQSGSARIIEEQRKQEELKRIEELRKREELKRIEELRKQEELKRIEEQRKQEELKRIEELRKQEELKRIEEQRKQEELKRIEEQRKQEELKRIEEQKEFYRFRNLCQHCGGKFKGIFVKKCRKCGLRKDY